MHDRPLQRPRCGHVLAPLIALSTLAIPGQGRASPIPPVVVLIAQKDQRESSLNLAKVLRYQLQGSGVLLTILWAAPGETDLPTLARRLAEAERALLVVWSGPPGSHQIHLYLPPQGDAKAQLRTLAKAAQSRTGRDEAAGLVVRSSVEAILASRREAPPPRPPPPVAQVTRSPSTRPRRITAGLALQYALVGYSSLTGRELAHSASLELALTFRRRWSAILGYAITPVRSQVQEITLIQERHGLLVGAAHTWTWGRLGLSARLLLDVDLVDSRTTVSDASYEPKAIPREVNVGLLGALRLEVALWRHLGVHAAAGAMVMLRHSDYTAESVLLSKPWPVRPMGFLGLNTTWP